MRKQWTAEETEFLEENYGVIQTQRIADKLNRTFNSVKMKAQKMGLGLIVEQGELIHFPKFVEVTKIDRATLMNWHRKYEMPITKKRFEKRVCYMIDPEQFWIWAKNNKNMIEWDKFDKWAIGKEPDWVEMARKAAFERVKQSKKSMKKMKWSQADEEKLIWMIKKQSYTFVDISDELGRTQGAIKRKLSDLDLKERPIYLDNHRAYTQEEIDFILASYKSGHGFDVIAKKLNRSESGIRGKVERLGYRFENRVLIKK